MNKIIPSLLAFCLSFTTLAQITTTYQDPIIIEDNFPLGWAWFTTKRECSQSSANSLFKHYPSTGNVYEIHTYSWDEGPVLVSLLP